MDIFVYRYSEVAKLDALCYIDIHNLDTGQTHIPMSKIDNSEVKR